MHPEDAEPRIVRDQLAGTDAVDVFGRQRDADDLELAPAAVDDRADAVAGAEVAGERERFADEHFIRAPRRRQASPAKEQIVQHRPGRHLDADQPPARRLGEIRNVQRHVDDDPRVGAGDAGNLRDAIAKVHRRARQPGEHVGESVPVVIGLLREPERVKRAQVHDEHRHAGADHHADRRRLPFQGPHVTQELTV